MSRETLRKILRLQLNHLFLPIALVILVLVILFHGQKIIQFELLIIAAMFYISTAFLHHYFDKSLTIETALEYILIAALTLIIFQGLLT